MLQNIFIQLAFYWVNRFLKFFIVISILCFNEVLPDKFVYFNECCLISECRLQSFVPVGSVNWSRYKRPIDWGELTLSEWIRNFFEVISENMYEKECTAKFYAPAWRSSLFYYIIVFGNIFDEWILCDTTLTTYENVQWPLPSYPQLRKDFHRNLWIFFLFLRFIVSFIITIFTLLRLIF